MKHALKGTDLAKFLAAQKATSYVEDGMKVGLGTGSTAFWMVKCLGERVRNERMKILAVPTSAATADLARSEGIATIALDDAGQLDLTIDGADEVDPQLNLIKGGGGALLLEKIVARASDRMVVIADEAKTVEVLGAFPLPVEVVRFGLQSTRGLILDLLDAVDVRSRDISLRMNRDQPLVTDQGHYILDLSLGVIRRPAQLAQALNQIPGVVETGLFINMCDTLVVGYRDGHVTVRETGESSGNFFEDSRA